MDPNDRWGNIASTIFLGDIYQWKMWVYNLKVDIQLENGTKDTSVIVFGEKKLSCKQAN